MTTGPVVLDRASHPISRRDIDPDALKVLYRLARHGYKAYLVGGAVRDLLMGKKPKDFDVATDARPGQIKKLFSNCFLVGRRFRLAHIRFKGGKVIEVATFRREPDPLSENPSDVHNTFGTPEEDAHRRDITINALFYDISTYSVIDYVGGLEDLARGRITVIGDPSVRYREDPVRMWRVLRHAARHGFSIEERSARAIEEMRGLLVGCSGARLYEELNKDLSSGCSARVFDLLLGFGMFSSILGGIGLWYERDGTGRGELVRLMEAYDTAVRSGAALGANVAYSVVLWPWAKDILEGLGHTGGDRAKGLIDRIESAGMAVTMPKAVRSAVVHIVLVVGAMMRSLERGVLKPSLMKRHEYAQALQVFSLLTRGVLQPHGDPFLEAFGQRHGHGGMPRRQGRKRRRRNRRPRGGNVHPGQRQGAVFRT